MGLQPFLIATLVTAMMMGPVIVLGQAWPAAPLRWLPILAFLAGLEAVYTTRWFTRIASWQMNRLAYRAAEFAVIVLVLRLFTWAVAGNWPTVATLQDILLSPSLILDPIFFIYLLLVGLAWERALTIGATFVELRLRPEELAYYTLPPSQQGLATDSRPPQFDRTALVNGFFKSWTFGGIVLGFFAAVSTVDLPGAAGQEMFNLRTIGRLGLPPAMLMALVVYFLVGFWLLSQARLAVLQARWLVNGVAADAAVTRSWRRSSIAVILAVALVAAFLPIGSTFALSRIIQALILVMILAINVMLALFAGLFYLLLALFMPGAGTREAVEVEPLPLPTIEAMPAGGESVIPPLVWGSLFWIIIAAALLYAVFFYLNRRGFRFEPEGASRFMRGFVAWLRGWWRIIAGRAAAMSQAARTRLQANQRPGTPTSPWRFIRLNALSPRDQVRYFYLSIVRRAGEQGVEREPSQTPSEYTRELAQGWPDAETEFENLTDAFLEARYSRKRIEAEEVNPIKETWKRVKAAVRKRRLEIRD